MDVDSPSFQPQSTTTSSTQFKATASTMHYIQIVNLTEG